MVIGECIGVRAVCRMRHCNGIVINAYVSL